MALRMLTSMAGLAVSQRWLLCAGRTPEVRVAGFPHARVLTLPISDSGSGEFRFTLEIIHPRLAGLVRQSAVFREQRMTSTFLWTLIAIQIAMGAFDTFYQHELTGAVAWRLRSATSSSSIACATRLPLLFLTLGWLEVCGFWAMIVIAVLVVEVVVT